MDRHETKQTEKGVMLMLDGKAWGITYEDGHSTSYGWIDPSKAEVSDPELCKKPSDLTYPGSYLIPEMSRGRLVQVVRHTRITVLMETQQ